MSATYYSTILRAWYWDSDGPHGSVVSQSRSDAARHADSGFVPDDRYYRLGGRFADCVEGCDADGCVGFDYLGSVLSLAPSGKYYMPWTSNQTADDERRDGAWYAALERVASKFGGWTQSGEGDPTDLYFGRYWTVEELGQSAAETDGTAE